MLSNPIHSSAIFEAVNPREALYKNLKGLIVRIPDLKPLFNDWKGIHHVHINENLSALKCKVQERLQILGFDENKRRRLEAADFALFTALWWPEAPFEQLQILAYLVIWLFTWDDEIDEPTGAYSEDMGGAQNYRAETLQFIRFHLGLSPDEANCQTQSHIIRSVDVICQALRESYTVIQRERFYQEIARFMAASEEEQRGRLEERVPTLEEYWSFRLGTSAVYIGTAVGEYSISSNLPFDIVRHESMQMIWNETNVIISITNDLLSLKKEMKLGCIDNIVSLTFASTNDIRRAIDESFAALRESKLRFDRAAEILVSVAARDELVSQQVESFLNVQRSNCVGNLIWSLETHRYNMRESINEDGSQSFTI